MSQNSRIRMKLILIIFGMIVLFFCHRTNQKECPLYRKRGNCFQRPVE